MNTKIIGISIAAFIGIIVLGSVLMPILNDATAKEDTFTNEGYFYMDEIDSGTAMTVAWDYTKPTTLTVNGVDVALPDKDHMSTIPFTVFCCDTWYLRYGYDTAYYVNIYQNAASTSYSGNVSDSKSLSISVTDAGVTTVNDGTAHTWSNATGNFFVISESGDYVMKKMDKDAYVLGDSPIFGYGRTYARSYYYTSELKGSVDDGITGEYYPEATIETAGWTISDVTLNSVKDADHEDLYKISTMTYEITGEGIQPYTATFSQYIVPAEITAERSVHFTDGQNAIFAVIPVMIILAVLLGVVALVIRSRMD